MHRSPYDEQARNRAGWRDEAARLRSRGPLLSAFSADALARRTIKSSAQSAIAAQRRFSSPLGPFNRPVVKATLRMMPWPVEHQEAGHAGYVLDYRTRLASSLRDLTPSLRNALRRWYSTVLGLMNS